MHVPGTRFGFLTLLVLSLAACRDSDTSPSPSDSLNLAGTWTGTLFHPGGGTSGVGHDVTWTATQNGSTVSGQNTMTHPVTDAVINGTLGGTVTATQVTLTHTVPQGNVPGYPNCSFTGTGTMPATTALITGTLTTTFSNCAGFNKATGPVAAQLTLSK